MQKNIPLNKKFHTLITGNIISHDWYNKILSKSGRPNFLAISVLSEIVYWYRPKVIQDEDTGSKKIIPKFKGDMWQTSYSYLEKKFSSNHQSIRRALVRLEELNLIERHFQTVHLRGQNYNNALFIRLNIENLLKISSCASITYTKANNQERRAFSTSKFVDPSLQISSDNIDNKIKKEYISRSDKSSFCKTSFLNKEQLKQESLDSIQVQILIPQGQEKKQCEVLTTDHSKQNPLGNKEENKNPGLIGKLFRFKRKKLTEFYPLTEEDAEVLRTVSSREFSLHYMNQLLLKLAKLKPEHGFFNKKNFLKYMTKALANELRDAIKVSNEGFRFKQEIEVASKEKYLEEVEYSSVTSQISQLKRKIVAVFDDDTAYEIIKNFEFNGFNEENNHFEVKLRNSYSLTDFQKKRLLEQVRVVYGNQIEDLKIIKETGSKNSTIKEAAKCFNLNLGKQGSTWYKISSKLAEYYGAALHHSWFSKLEAEEDTEGRSITLKAPTAFIRDWIESNYKYMIENLCKDEKYNFRGMKYET